MNAEIKVVSESAETVYISHPESSYGIFCYNQSGDLFLNSDWGMYGYAWRHIGDKTFKQFLSGTNADYIVGKFWINYNMANRKKIPPNWEKNLIVLVNEFINHLKANP